MGTMSMECLFCCPNQLVSKNCPQLAADGLCDATSIPLGSEELTRCYRLIAALLACIQDTLVTNNQQHTMDELFTIPQLDQ